MFLRICCAVTVLMLGAAAQAEPAPLKPPAVTAPATPLPAAAAATQSAAPAGTMSESKFLGVLYSEIAKRTPEKSPAGEGEVTASFHVGANGKVDKVTIDKTTSPAHAEMVKKILAAVVVPAPPGGAMDVGQTFKFR